MLLNSFIPTESVRNIAQRDADLVVAREDLPNPQAMAPLFVFTHSDEAFIAKLCEAQRDTTGELYHRFLKMKEGLTSQQANTMAQTKPHEFEDACLAAKDSLDLTSEALKVWNDEEAMYLDRVSDLLDTRPNYDLTSDGKYPIATIITEYDMWQGTSSPGVFILMCLQILMGFVAWNFIPTKVGEIVVGGLTFLASLFITKWIEDGRKGHQEGQAVTWTVTYALPSWGPLTTVVGVAIGSALGFSHVPSLNPIPLALGLALWVGLPLITLAARFTHADSGKSDKAMAVLGRSVMTLFAMLVLMALPGVLMTMSPVLVPVGLILSLVIPCAIAIWEEPREYYRHLEKARIYALGMRDLNSQGARNGMTKNSHRYFRFQQLMRAAGDTKPTISLGTSEGYLAQKGSKIAPDAGKECRMSADDIKRHILVTGMTGGGKTSSTILPIVTQWYVNKMGGYYISCGKGVLALDFKDVEGFTLIQPGVDLGIYEGLTPQAIVNTYAAVNGVKNANEPSTGNSQFFNVKAKILLEKITFLMFYLHEAELANIEQQVKNGRSLEELEKARVYPITPWTHYTLIRDVADFNKNVNIKLLHHLDYVHSFHPLVLNKKQNYVVGDNGETVKTYSYNFADSPDGYLMKDCIAELNALANQDPDTRSNVFSTLMNWIAPLFSHRDLVAWSRIEHGVRLDSIQKGAGMGLYLPVLTYGQGALLIQALLKNNVMTNISLRTNDWKNDADQKEVLLVVDEAHTPGMIGQDDVIAASQFRSKGGALLFAAQAKESFISALGEKDAATLLANFSTQMALEVGTSEATRKHIRQVIGEGLVQSPILPAGRVLVAATISSAAHLASFDEEHPDALRYKDSRRQGAFDFDTSLGNNSNHHDVSLVQRGSLGSLQTRIPIVTSMSTKFGPWLELGEIDANLRQGVALVKWYRGGYARHDFIRLNYMKSTTSKPTA